MGGNQLGFSDYELTNAKKRTKREKFLSEMEVVVPWQELIALIEPNHLDVDPEDRSRVNESPHPARLGRGLDHETHQANSGADHPQAQNRRAADRSGQDRHRRLPGPGGDAADVPPLEIAVRGYAGRGGQTADSTGKGERPAQKASGGGGAGEGDALAEGFCEAVGPCRGGSDQSGLV
jgi:hypothetical protein